MTYFYAFYQKRKAYMNWRIVTYVSKTNIVLVNLSLLERKKFAGYKKKMKDNNFYRKINKQKLEFYFVVYIETKRNLDPY